MRALVAVGATLLVLGLTPVASAYTVSSDYADACHEMLTLQGYLNYGVDLPDQDLPRPSGEIYEAIAESLINRLRLDYLSEQQQLVVVSLLIGVRSPDTDGHALLDLDSLRTLHASPEGQYAHSLRATDDDGPEGNGTAVQGIRQHIADRIRTSFEYVQKPSEQQIIKAPFYLEFYGLVEIEVWAPAFYLGEAIHALQDSFSHALRTADFRTIVHVMNYAEAIGSGFDEERDGLAHSDSMDMCEGETAPMVNAAAEATTQLFITLLGTNDGTRQDAVNAFLDDWVVYEPGCTFENNFCESPWLPVVRESQTGPYLEDFLGCDVGRDAGFWLWRRR